MSAIDKCAGTYNTASFSYTGFTAGDLVVFIINGDKSGVTSMTGATVISEYSGGSAQTLRYIALCKMTATTFAVSLDYAGYQSTFFRLK